MAVQDVDDGDNGVVCGDHGLSTMLVIVSGDGDDGIGGGRNDESKHLPHHNESVTPARRESLGGAVDRHLAARKRKSAVNFKSEYIT